MGKQEQTKGDFKYDKEGKVVFEASETGKWNITTPQAFELITDDDSPIYRQGIDPYQPEV